MAKRSERDYLVTRLAREAPALYEALTRGDITLHRALIHAGIRPTRLTLDVRRPETIARSLRKHLTREQVTELRYLLSAGDDAS